MPRSKPNRSEFTDLQQLPNIGPAMADDLRLLGLDRPDQLPGCDPWQLYLKLCKLTRQRQDPCVLDVLIAAVRFMEGDPPRPWWFYTKERKQRFGQIPDELLQHLTLPAAKSMS